MKYAVEMETCAVMYIPSFITIYTGTEGEVKGENTNTDTRDAT
jgi:hypothetical protein